MATASDLQQAVQEDSGVTSASPPALEAGLGANLLSEISAEGRAADTLSGLAAEVRNCARYAVVPDLSEREAMLALSERAELLLERLYAIVDWADYALNDPQEFDPHGVKNLDGPVFDEARAAIVKAEGRTQ